MKFKESNNDLRDDSSVVRPYVDGTFLLFSLWGSQLDSCYCNQDLR